MGDVKDDDATPAPTHSIFKGQSPGLGAQVGRGDLEEEAGSAKPLTAS